MRAFSLQDPALLALSDGTLFWGEAIGASGYATGEVVFNTAMTGYQEILTDPSYYRQIVTLTYPHIGNVGTNGRDEESPRAYASALVVRDCSPVVSNWRSDRPLTDYLKANQVVGIAGVDTRHLTRLLRDSGAQNGCVAAGKALDPEAAVAKARAFAGLQGVDLAKEVSTVEPYAWDQGVWRLEDDGFAPAPSPAYRVTAYDYVIKRNILRLLTHVGLRVTVVPATSPPELILASDPDGVFLSNGPGDPEPCGYAIEAARAIMARGVPLFGICLGHQLLGLASGARTVKMKFGHHGANHPVVELATGKVIISSQNHGFAVDEQTLPRGVRPTHRSLFDGSLQGIERLDCPAFGFQGHPEASPGPHDVRPLFTRFVEAMAAHRQSSSSVGA